jgi:hypothetical protein
MNAIAMTILEIGFAMLPLLIWSSGRNKCDRDRLDTAGRSSSDRLSDHRTDEQGAIADADDVGVDPSAGRHMIR